MELDAEDLANSAFLPKVSPIIEELLRGLVTMRWKDDELPAVLKLHANLSRRRRRAPGTGPYLDVRKGHKGRAPKIVIMDGGNPISTGVDAATDDMKPETSALALVHHRAYETARQYLEDDGAQRDPLSFRITYVLRRWLEEIKPAKGLPNRKKKMIRWKALGNCVDHLCGIFEGAALRDIDIDTGRNYYARRIVQELKKGKRDPENIKDSPIGDELSCLEWAIDWFAAKKKLPVHPAKFAWPDFIEREMPFYTYDDMMALLWACLGFDATKGWKRTHVDREVQRWLVRFFLLYFLTGTRYDANGKLAWGFNDHVGCIDYDNGVIWRNGAQAVRSRQKPKRRSDLLAMMTEIVRGWHEDDVRLGAKYNFKPLWVIHEKGVPPKNFKKKVVAALARSGVKKSSHKCKHGGVTLLGYCGVTFEEVAKVFGNDETTIKENYSHVDWEKVAKMVAPIPKDEIRWRDLKLVSPTSLAPELVVQLVADLKEREAA
ncbi:hypothetical protein ABIC09_004974 [Bradyrhizobium sp. S3.12.5]|uniref:hypothetical protein n=1 Tax=Bradyrhizobium sp. S3.12.5 TaxID=3156386 RepID=UPI003395FAFA